MNKEMFSSTKNDFMMSKEIDQVAAAFCMAQVKMPNPPKNKKGFGYKYADLPTILELVRPILDEHGLSVPQLVSNNNGVIKVVTLLLHKSGQYIGSEYECRVDNVNKGMNQMQSEGSAITYIRRYAIIGLLCIAADEDDDGASAEVKPNPPRQAKASVQQKSHNELLRELMDRVEHLRIPAEEVQGWLTLGNVATLEDFSVERLAKTIAYVDRKSWNA